MGADLIVNVECEAKRALGDGDTFQGTVTMLRMRKSSSQAMAIAGQLQQAGVGLDVPCIKVVVETAEGKREREVSVVDLLAESAPLREHDDACPTCPANITNQPYGCVGYLPYPIEQDAELWLAARVQPEGSLGHKLLCDALRDFAYTGEMFAQWRERGLITAPEPQTVVLRDNEAGITTVDTNQLFQAVFGVGSRLEPTHCALVLMWLGALAIDGEVPPEAEVGPLKTLVNLDSPEERRARTDLVLGDRSDSQQVKAMQLLLAYLYEGWVSGVGLLVDA